MGKRWNWNWNIWSCSNHASRKETFYSKCWFGISWSLHLHDYKQSGKRLSKFSSFCLSPTEFWQHPRPVFQRPFSLAQWILGFWLVNDWKHQKGNDNTDHEVILSGSVTLDCKVSGGVPIPQIKWYKFGEPLRPNLKLGFSHAFHPKYPKLKLAAVTYTVYHISYVTYDMLKIVRNRECSKSSKIEVFEIIKMLPIVTVYYILYMIYCYNRQHFYCFKNLDFWRFWAFTISDNFQHPPFLAILKSTFLKFLKSEILYIFNQK